ncbi:MAG: membrane-associating domain-containing protein [Monoraphidium minutum]|nr:MAG: membrane-associating domain-containing protein [Monoraphidium minutum]
MASCFYASKIILRIIHAVFALIAFAASAYVQSKGHVEPRINFMVFVGVTAWLISMFYAIVSCSEGLQRTFWGAVEVGVNTVWVVFWLAAGAAYAAYAKCKPSQIDLDTPFAYCNAILASEAFAWMSFLLWVPSLALSVVDMRRGEGITGGGKRYPVGTPA